MVRINVVINIKKVQFFVFQEMKYILIKCEEVGNDCLIFCECGFFFGYNNLVVDMFGFGIMKQFEYLVFFDVIYVLQMFGGCVDFVGGWCVQVIDLVKVGFSQKFVGLFFEVYLDFEYVKCDGLCVLCLNKFEVFLFQFK